MKLKKDKNFLTYRLLDHDMGTRSSLIQNESRLRKKYLNENKNLQSLLIDLLCLNLIVDGFGIGTYISEESLENKEFLEDEKPIEDEKYVPYIRFDKFISVFIQEGDLDKEITKIVYEEYNCSDLLEADIIAVFASDGSYKLYDVNNDFTEFDINTKNKKFKDYIMSLGYILYYSYGESSSKYTLAKNRESMENTIAVLLQSKLITSEDFTGIDLVAIPENDKFKFYDVKNELKETILEKNDSC